MRERHAKVLRDLWYEKKRGNTIILVAAALPMLIGSAGLATDTIQWGRCGSASFSGPPIPRRSPASTTVSSTLVLTTTTATAVSHDLSLNQHTNITLQPTYPLVTFPAD